HLVGRFVSRERSPSSPLCALEGSARPSGPAASARTHSRRSSRGDPQRDARARLCLYGRSPGIRRALARVALESAGRKHPPPAFVSGLTVEHRRGGREPAPPLSSGGPELALALRQRPRGRGPPPP